MENLSEDEEKLFSLLHGLTNTKFYGNIEIIYVNGNITQIEKVEKFLPKNLTV